MPGDPVPQGSHKVMRGRIFDDNPRVKGWKERVRGEAALHCDEMVLGPVVLSMVFSLERPKSHYRTGRFAGELKQNAPILHAQPPDLDKLARAVCDALTGVVYLDDGQVASIVAVKMWVEDGLGCGLRLGWGEATS